ncbi:MAG: hypothetical protein K8R40_02455 [Anaerolineaceae bacterium]|nr:hypothetical protein [Anaerolineaceae bacterium]
MITYFWISILVLPFAIIRSKRRKQKFFPALLFCVGAYFLICATIGSFITSLAASNPNYFYAFLFFMTLSVIAIYRDLKNRPNP